MRKLNSRRVRDVAIRLMMNAHRIADEDMLRKEDIDLAVSTLLDLATVLDSDYDIEVQWLAALSENRLQRRREMQRHLRRELLHMTDIAIARHIAEEFGGDPKSIARDMRRADPDFNRKELRARAKKRIG